MGYSIFHKTYEKSNCSFFWEGMKTYIQGFVEARDAFQRNMSEMVKTHGELQQLPIPATIWIDISMDFIAGLVKNSNKLVIVVVVDHLSKYGHFFLYHTQVHPPQLP
jgi:hypothetical protein